MTEIRERDLAGEGRAALATGDWQAARERFEAIGEPDAEALDGLGQALWWLGEPDASLAARQRAFEAYRRRGAALDAARLAVWLAREYRDGHGNAAAANGWSRRAARLASTDQDGPVSGWLALLGAEAAPPDEAAALARRALEIARAHDDGDAELRARAQLGLAETRRGRVSVGMDHLDEAMAAVTASAVRDWETFGYVSCALIAACEAAGDAARMEQWSEVVVGFLETHPHMPLLAFCGSCCGDMFLAAGAWEPAETELRKALAALEAGGQTARCVHPAARLAQLRVLQGRFEDAAALLAGYEGLAEAVAPAVALHLATGRYAVAAELLRRRLATVGESSMLAAPLLALQVDLELAQGDVSAARQSAKQLAEIGRRSAVPRVEAEAAFARGKVAAAAGDDDARESLEQALSAFVPLGMPLHEARARLSLARVLAEPEPELARAEARSAFAAFERLGAGHDADAASALLRELGPAGRAGPKGHGTLTRREEEVLRLVAHGLTNAEIAERLFISVKTAGNHVSSILMKLGMRNRAEAAAYAQHLLG